MKVRIAARLEVIGRSLNVPAQDPFGSLAAPRVASSASGKAKTMPRILYTGPLFKTGRTSHMTSESSRSLVPPWPTSAGVRKARDRELTASGNCRPQAAARHLLFATRKRPSMIECPCGPALLHLANLSVMSRSFESSKVGGAVRRSMASVSNTDALGYRSVPHCPGCFRDSVLGRSLLLGLSDRSFLDDVRIRFVDYNDGSRSYSKLLSMSEMH
jgi:hypothetical protein